MYLFRHHLSLHSLLASLKQNPYWRLMCALWLQLRYVDLQLASMRQERRVANVARPAEEPAQQEHSQIVIDQTQRVAVAQLLAQARQQADAGDIQG